MRSAISFALAASFVLAGSSAAQIRVPAVPAAPREAAADTLFGTRVPDPYRWLERYEEPAVRAWYQAEDSAARAVVSSPAYVHFLARLAEARRSKPYNLRGFVEQQGSVYYLKRLAGEPLHSLYVRDAYGGERRLYSPAQAPGVADAVLTGFDVSPGAAHVVVYYTAGGDEREIAVLLDVATGRVLDGEVAPRARDLRWLPDGRGFVYGTSRDLARDATWSAQYRGLPARMHLLGTAPAADPVVFDPLRTGGDSTARVGLRVDGAAGVVQMYLRREAEVRAGDTFLAPVEEVAAGAPAWRRVAGRADSVTDVTVRGPWLYGVAFAGAPEGRVVRVPIGSADAGAAAPDWSRADRVLQLPGLNLFSASPVFARDGIYWVDGSAGASRLFRFAYDTRTAQEIAPPPFEGSFGPLDGSADQPGIRLYYGGWTRGDRYYRYLPAVGRVEELPALLNPADPFDHLDGLTSTTTYATSHDGVKVPITLLRLRGATGPRPTILYGYGAYGVTDDAFFRAWVRPWVEAGGTYAFCHARGGGYGGTAWHEGGMKATKPNTWKDAIACGEHLVRTGVTRPEMLGINGVSAGGIFAGGAITERPDLFGAAAIEVGIADMVRWARSNAGPDNFHEFGSPDTEAGFRALLAMSPYHHVRPGVRYPATLLFAAYNDARVSPWHPAKMAAALRFAGGAAALPGGERPVLLRVEFAGGHGGDDPVDVREARWATTLAFFAARLGLKVP